MRKQIPVWLFSSTAKLATVAALAPLSFATYTYRARPLNADVRLSATQVQPTDFYFPFADICSDAAKWRFVRDLILERVVSAAARVNDWIFCCLAA